MGRTLSKLSDATVKAAHKPGRHSDGGGLYLNVSMAGTKSWLFMWVRDGKRREMGLGPYPTVSLAKARAAAADHRLAVQEGRDPIQERDAAPPPTFGEFAGEVAKSLARGFRNDKHRAQWLMTLSIQRGADGAWLDTGYCIKLRDKRVDEIDTADVLAVLTPIWTTKPETASRVRGRVEKVLDAARAKQLADTANPARWRGHLDHLLPKRQKLARGHHAAMPYSQVPTFVEQLRASGSVASLALEWTILAAARTGETTGARLSEIDRKGKVWTVPPERMKAGRQHRVPLTDRMIEIYDLALELHRGDDPDGYLFPGARRGHPLSNMAMTQQMRRLKASDATVHGFRSSFRDWAGEETSFRPDLAEAALAHVIGDETERAYRRKDALEQRRKLMTAWANYITAPKLPTVVRLRIASD